MFHHEVINRHVQPGSKPGAQNRGSVSFPQSSGPETPPGPPPGPKTRCRPGQVEKIVHPPVWCWKFSKTEKMLIEAKL